MVVVDRSGPAPVTVAAPEGYWALREHAAWLDLSARGKIAASGEDRARLLHAMTTNDVQRLTPGAGCYAYFLSAQGRILADVNVLCRPDRFLLDTEPETRATVFQHLDKFIIADDVVLEDITSALVTIAVEGPGSAAVLEKLGAPDLEHELEHEYDNAEWERGLAVRASYTGSPGVFLIAPAGEREALIERLQQCGAARANAEAFRTVRIENGRPRYGEDIAERYLAQETNQSRALNFSKGCYLGQEIVERVRSRGQIHRVLVPVQIEGDRPPEPGVKLRLGDLIAGEITSAVYSPALAKVAALAYVRLEHAKPGATLWIGDRAVRVAGGVAA